LKLEDIKNMAIYGSSGSVLIQDLAGNDR